jgi:hypothetical protein
LKSSNKGIILLAFFLGYFLFSINSIYTTFRLVHLSKRSQAQSKKNLHLVGFFYVHFSTLDFQDLKKVNAAKHMEKIYHCLSIGALWYNHGFFVLLWAIVAKLLFTLWVMVHSFDLKSLENQAIGNNINTYPRKKSTSQNCSN